MKKIEPSGLVAGTLSDDDVGHVRKCPASDSRQGEGQHQEQRIAVQRHEDESQDDSAGPKQRAPLAADGVREEPRQIHRGQVADLMEREQRALHGIGKPVFGGQARQDGPQHGAHHPGDQERVVRVVQQRSVLLPDVKERTQRKHLHILRWRTIAPKDLPGQGGFVSSGCWTPPCRGTG